MDSMARSWPMSPAVPAPGAEMSSVSSSFQLSVLLTFLSFSGSSFHLSLKSSPPYTVKS